MAEAVMDDHGVDERVVIWANPVPLDCGILPSVDRSTSKFTFPHLKKLLTYIKSKGKHSYPWLSYSVWRHIAKNKLHMPDGLSWLYFETFDTVSDVSIADRLKYLGLLSECGSQSDKERLHKQVCVDTVKFVLFLYLQNAPRSSLCASLVTREEWPSPESDKKLKSSSDHSHLSFMLRNLHHLLLLVASSDDCIDIEGVRSLEFLLLTSADKSHHLPLTALAVLPNQAAVNGASQDLKSFFLPHFEVWLRSCLVLNPFGPQAIKGGARDRRCPAFRSDVTGRIVTNIVSAPVGSHVVLIHGVNKQTLAKDYTGLDNSLVYIQNCRSSYIYLLGPMKSVVIEKCSRCVIVLGAVERCLMVNNCNGICLVAACRRAHVCTLSHSTLHLLTMTPPILFPGNHSLIFAPYNTHYPLLEDHLTRAGLNPLINSWDVPHSMVNEGGGVEPYTLMDPGNFYKLEVPFVMEGPTRVNPTILPGRYEEALKERKRRIDEWYGVVKEANLTPDKQRELQKIVQERFKEWLEVTGHKREIYDLGRNISTRDSPSS